MKITVSSALSSVISALKVNVFPGVYVCGVAGSTRLNILGGGLGVMLSMYETFLGTKLVEPGYSND